MRKIGPHDVLENGTIATVSGKRGKVIDHKIHPATPNGFIVVHEIEFTEKIKVFPGGIRKYVPMEKPQNWKGNYSFVTY